MFSIVFFLIYLSFWGIGVWGLPDEGKWHCTLDQNISKILTYKTLFAGSQIFIEVVCHSDSPDKLVTIDWFVTESSCWNDRSLDEINDIFDIDSIKDNRTVGQEVITNCNSYIMLNPVKGPGYRESPAISKKSDPQTGGSTDLQGEERVSENLKKSSHPKQNVGSSVFTVPKDGFYTLVLRIQGTDFKADVQLEMIGKHGYLSAADWPLLPFYGVMCLVYVIFGLAWLIVSFCKWRELLRIQFWIGGVILLGMLEKAAFYALYQNTNMTGQNSKSVAVLAECVSFAKRTLARMLVIIVSLGFGIVKPRLGSMLHRLIGVGACYYVLASVECYIRFTQPKFGPSNQLLIATIPLTVLDSIICWWIFKALYQTTNTLWLRKNYVKLNLYRHFANTLIFAVLASVVFMIYSIKVHRLALCVTDWKDIWVDEAYWHVLFSVLLLVIMILWRPTNNNQRYAFSPLLGAAEDDEEEDQFVNDACGIKMRTHSRPTSPKPKPSNDDDILKWVDENIPTAGVEANKALAFFDAEDEILTTKYEMSKMQ